MKFFVLIAFLWPAFTSGAAVVFPGPSPGNANSVSGQGNWTLENEVLAATWQASDGKLRPLQLINKLTGQKYAQSGSELFRVSLTAPQTNPGVVVAVRLDAQRIVALASRNGLAWTELATFSRQEFPGEPQRVRFGKMNLQAEEKSYAADPGAPGHCVIQEISPAGMGGLPAAIDITARANAALTKEAAFPAGAKLVSCRINKDTDQGMSWGPALAVIWEEGKKFLLIGVRDGKPTFNITTAAGEKILETNLEDFPRPELAASGFQLAGPPKIIPLAPAPQGVRVADRVGGLAMEALLVSPGGLHGLWRAELRNGSSYLRQTVEFSSPAKKLPLYAVELADVRIPGAQTIGSVPGSPVAGGGMFFGVEMPGAANAINDAGARIGFGCELQLSPQQSYAFSSVTGIAPAGQLRRAFLFYLERERARPSSPFLHYNAWYDLGFSVDAAKMLDVVSNFNAELVVKRGVPVQSYLVDDGWDAPGKGLWAENQEKFPGGFPALSAAMARLKAHLSIWISPLGGYGGREERTATAQELKLVPAGAPLDFAYPGYKQWFQDRCLQLMREDGVNAFKWDKAGDGVSPHFLALLDVARHLRQENPEVFINVTVGTWPSPFWLNHVDSTWRNGSADVGWAGKGDDREKWLTFRDGNCRKFFVEKSPLYPLNSVMHHGLVHGRCFQGERVGQTGPHLLHEARSYFANGTSLQELYLTPSLMTPAAWDQVAEAARWAHTNAEVLTDAHWTGGDPLKLQVYGYAAWTPRQGTLMLRNPDSEPQSITLEAAQVFELPADAPHQYSLQSPYADQRIQKLTLSSGHPQTVSLEPFEVIVFDAKPSTSTR
ncbi:MAG: hypothetical protein WCS94_03590 [Verrucomicrobiota bacterium]